MPLLDANSGFEPRYEIERDAEGVPVRMWWRGFQLSWKDQEMSWREEAADIIGRTIAETDSKDLPLLRQRLRDAYPWGERKNHPYKIWLDEIKRQLGLKPPLQQGGRRPEQVPPEQGRLL